MSEHNNHFENANLAESSYSTGNRCCPIVLNATAAGAAPGAGPPNTDGPARGPSERLEP